jgi:hypothetical protein
MPPLAKLLPLTAFALGLGLALAWFFRPSAPAAPDLLVANSTTSERLLASATDRPGGATAPGASPTAPADAPADEEFTRIADEIEEAYTTYSPEALPKLAPYLTHPDPELRALAREAVVQVGHAEGAVLLRRAARSLRDPREAVALLEAADFLELPPAPTPLAATKPRALLPSPGQP